MIPTLSPRAYRHLHNISRKAGMDVNDEEIHDMGLRLLVLCHVAANVKSREEKVYNDLLTETETKALEALKLQFAITGHLCSARELSDALAYKSSRSGHVLLQNLLAKGFLVRSGGGLTFPRK